MEDLPIYVLFYIMPKTYIVMSIGRLKEPMCVVRPYSVQYLLLLAKRALPVDYQCRIESLKTQYFIDCRSVVQ